MHVLTHEQATTLLRAAQGERLEALFVLALSTGAREGELLALRWKDVDLEASRPTITIRHTLRRTKATGLALHDPKTKGSHRIVPLGTAAVNALRAHRTAQKAERIKVGSNWTDLDLVFANEVGRPMECQNLLRRVFKPLLERVGLPPIRFHDLRHTFATLSLEAGVPVKQVSAMLGHASIAITLDLYAHATERMEDQALAAVNALYG
jgi:integrase